MQAKNVHSFSLYASALSREKAEITSDALPLGALVSYGDMANPRKTYAVVEETAGRYGQKCIALDGSGQSVVSQSDIKGLGGWQREEGEADAETLASLPALRAEVQAEQGRERKEQARRHAEDAERIKAELRTKYPWAKPKGGNLSEHARAAANLRKELSLTFPGVKFSVKSSSFSMGNDVNVSWSFGPMTEEVDKVSDKYQDGHFDGMEDIYNHDGSAYGEAVSAVLGRAKYVMTSRSFPQETYDRAQRELCTLQSKEYDGPYTRHLLGENDRESLQHHASMLLHRTSFPAGIETFARVEHTPFTEQNGRDWARIVFETKLTEQPKAEGKPTRRKSETVDLGGVLLTWQGDWTWIDFGPAQLEADAWARAAIEAAGGIFSRKRQAFYFKRHLSASEVIGLL